MKKLTTILNIIAIILAAYALFAFSHKLQLINILIFGMALSSIYGQQKKVFHWITLILNVLCFGFGLFAIIGILTMGGLPANSSFFTSIIPLFIMFVLVPFMNLKYVYPKIKT
ncbi:MAG: hypothetical protein ACRBHB_12640 [Arenicella sp.]